MTVKAKKNKNTCGLADTFTVKLIDLTSSEFSDLLAALESHKTPDSDVLLFFLHNAMKRPNGSSILVNPT